MKKKTFRKNILLFFIFKSIFFGKDLLRFIFQRKEEIILIDDDDDDFLKSKRKWIFGEHSLNANLFIFSSLAIPSNQLTKFEAQSVNKKHLEALSNSQRIAIERAQAYIDHRELLDFEKKEAGLERF